MLLHQPAKQSQQQSLVCRCAVSVVQVHGVLAASPGRPRLAPSVKELLVLMLEAARKPILWYLTAAGFLVRIIRTLGP
jgi:hypothetical protein